MSLIIVFIFLPGKGRVDMSKFGMYSVVFLNGMNTITIKILLVKVRYVMEMKFQCRRLDSV